VNEVVAGTDADGVAGALDDVMARAGADAVNLRVHAPGITPPQVRDQIAALADVVTALRSRRPPSP
jgi:hypothetical protein